MFNMSKKAFWVPYDEGNVYPTVVKAHQAISKYCDENGDSYSFKGDDEVVINDKLYEIYRAMNLEAVVITGLSAEKSEFFRFLKLIISRLPRTLASRETENVFLQFFVY